MIPFMDWINLLEQLTELRKLVYSWIKSNEEIHAEGPEQRSFSPCEVWGQAWWHVEAFWFTNLESLGILFLDYYGGFIYIGVPD